MDALIRLADEQTDYLEKQIASFIPRHIISNGWEYYRTRKVFAVEVIEGNAIYGAVNGSAVYAVVLDADEFTYSRCTCPYHGYCKHLAAVYFQYIALSGEDAAAVYNRLTNDVVTVQAPTTKKEETAADQPKEESSVSEWRAWMSEAYGDVWRQCRQSLHPMQPILSEMKGTARSWPKTKQRLHWLHVIEFVLEQVERAYAATESYSRYYYEMSFTRNVDPWIAHFEELASEIVPAGLSGLEREWLHELVKVLRRRAAEPDPTLLRWDMLYHVVCHPLTEDDKWRSAERAELESFLVDSPAYHIKTRSFICASLAVMDVIEDSDGQAVERLCQTDFDRTSDYVYRFAEQRLSERNWPALKLWMDYLERNLADCRNSAVLKPFMLLCRKAAVQESDKAEWEKRLTAFLPVSYQELSAHWLETGSYKKWADLQLYVGIRPGEIDVQDLRAITKAQPAALIPLYHQSVDESVGSRNRQGYRTAVKLLKKLEKLYKAAGKSERWERYIKELSGKYIRMRAFQEELRKGKYIT
ncbi:SWIM zinc finger domain-containing protein [Paenibacillus tarimensis]